MFTYLQGKPRRRTRALNETAEAGFTLIELLVVIVIMGVLSAIVVFSVRGINDKGQGVACKTDKSTIETAEEAYYADRNRGTYGTMEQLVKGGFLSDYSEWHDANPVDDFYAVTPLPKLKDGRANPCA
ncbi:prepilin-type N-terminal cleavage/methylation domain-containing protein [Streptomyces sp. NPDC048659]|uniref:competence type IV pilus major pilin ComGC n=1 Tax=Streptomyces sp. NPDC048659 TaxID=3155489 RepID=UPI0034465140